MIFFLNVSLCRRAHQACYWTCWTIRPKQVHISTSFIRFAVVLLIREKHINSFIVLSYLQCQRRFQSEKPDQTGRRHFRTGCGRLRRGDQGQSGQKGAAERRICCGNYKESRRKGNRWYNSGSDESKEIAESIVTEIIMFVRFGMVFKT